MDGNHSRLTVITDEISKDLNFALDTCKEIGISSVDLRGIWGKNIVELNEEDIGRVQTALKAKDMHAYVITGPLFKCYLPDSRKASKRSSSFSKNFDKNFDTLNQQLYLAEKLGCNYIRGFGFIKDGRKHAEIWNQLINYYHEAASIAKDKGKTILVENEHITYLDSFENTLKFFEELAEPNVKCLLDPGNFYNIGQLLSPEDYVPILRYMEHMHVKDAKYRIPRIGAIFRAVGDGNLRYRELFEFFIKNGYKGKFSLETHVLFNKEKTSIKSLHTMKKWLNSI
jgi:sugar phosphate isomerase/epimerase